MKKVLCAVLMLAVLLGCACAEETATALWSHEAGWMNFTLALAQDGLDEVWEKAAAAFGASLGLEGLGGAQLKSMMLQGHVIENSVEDLSIEGDRFTGRKSDGTELFSREYSLIETIREDGILGGEAVYVFGTEDADAGEYKYLLITEPQKAEGEDAAYTTFNLVCTKEDQYRSIFDMEKSNKAVAVCAMIEKDTSEEGLAFAIEKLFSNPVIIK